MPDDLFLPAIIRPRYRLIFLCDRDSSLVAKVDNVDYEWAIQWKWSYKVSNMAGGRTEMFYARRATRINSVPITLWLHKEILKQAGKIPPTDQHTIGDHKNGDSLDCRRRNLRWATPSENASNRRVRK